MRRLAHDEHVARGVAQDLPGHSAKHEPRQGAGERSIDDGIHRRRQDGDREVDATERLAELEAVGLGARSDHFPSALSGGEQQRVAIARALVKDPGLLLADEPTGSLDLETGRSVLALLRAASSDRGHTVLIVTHNSATAARCFANSIGRTCSTAPWKNSTFGSSSRSAFFRAQAIAWASISIPQQRVNGRFPARWISKKPAPQTTPTR